MGLNWKEFELPGKRLPKWKRTFAVDDETGQVFVAAALTGDAEHLVYICASDDQQPVSFMNEHYYVPADWMANEFPNTKSLCKLIRRSTCSLELVSPEPKFQECASSSNKICTEQ